jgi:hypothetical protein
LKNLKGKIMSTQESSHSSALTDAERKQIAADFHKAVNMSHGTLKKWLESDDSKRVGYKSDGGESVGHQSGQRIVKLLDTPAGNLSDDDFQHMRKVVGYVHRHMAQGPSKHDIATSDWRYSLMNWGHDPLEDRR